MENIKPEPIENNTNSSILKSYFYKFYEMFKWALMIIGLSYFVNFIYQLYKKAPNPWSLEVFFFNIFGILKITPETTRI